MKRLLCLWFPQWPLQRLRRDVPSLCRRPVVLSEESPRGWHVRLCSPEAARRGIRAGMPLAEAEALADSADARRRPIQFLETEPEKDRAALQQWATACQKQFSPLVMLEESERPEGLFLDVTGCGHLFGGERPLMDAVLTFFHQAGLAPQAAMAETIGAAWALAHDAPPGKRPEDAAERSRARSNSAARRSPRPKVRNSRPPHAGVIVPPGETASWLSDLPAAALRLPEAVLDLLTELDLQRVGSLMAMPAASLGERFGPILNQRLRQALGFEEELLVPYREERPPAARWRGEAAVTDRRALGHLLSQLLEHVLAECRERTIGALRVLCRVQGPEALPVEYSIEIVRPCQTAAHLMSLLELQWERNPLPEEASFLEVVVARWGSMERAQAELFDGLGRPQIDAAFQTLLERLTSRLGPEAVVRAVSHPEAQPELALRFEPAVATEHRAASSHGGRRPGATARKKKDLAWHGEPPESPGGDERVWRPLRMLETPLAVQVFAIAPDGPPQQVTWAGHSHRVTKTWGPERIETGWWRGALVRRDYYRIELAGGLWLWGFRNLSEGGWFVQGLFD